MSPRNPAILLLFIADNLSSAAAKVRKLRRTHLRAKPIDMFRDLRASENFHIVLWLLKDLCWVMVWKPLGLAMFIPTFLMAVHIAWRMRRDLGELLHCIAVVCWITANGIWMMGEFWFEDTKRHWAVPFFIAGILVVGWYYAVMLPRKRRQRPQHS
ncbi:MAG: hypothetical protein IPK70_04910 [Flavobacteriales bacterium]|nr:hypothetical protein [Flavobacteriales bacterium]